MRKQESRGAYGRAGWARLLSRSGTATICASGTATLRKRMGTAAVIATEKFFPSAINITNMCLH